MKKKMSVNELRQVANQLADDFLAIGENATESEYRKAFSKLFKSKGIWQWMDSAKYGSTLCGLLFFSQKYDDLSTSLSLIEELYPSYSKDCEYDYINKCYIHEQWAAMLIQVGNESDAYEHLKKAAYYIFIDNISYNDYEYFSFRDFSEFALDDIKNNTICLAHPGTFNDPMDTILLRWNQYLCDAADNDIDKTIRLLYKKVYDHIKVRCFVRNGKLPRNVEESIKCETKKSQDIEEVNSLMWAHYANYHKGFCVKYKLPSIIVNNQDENNLTWTRIGNIEYQPEMIFAERKEFGVLNVLFSKHDVWEYEKEVRIVHYDPNDSSDYKTITIPEGSIQEVYLGLRCSDVNRERMKLLLRNRNIRLFQMKVDPNNCYKLIKERIL